VQTGAVKGINAGAAGDELVGQAWRLDEILLAAG